MNNLAHFIHSNISNNQGDDRVTLSNSEIKALADLQSLLALPPHEVAKRLRTIAYPADWPVQLPPIQ
ncbi:MAG: hypothetical protein AAF490_07785 [Chloroflexota bacterium]